MGSFDVEFCSGIKSCLDTEFCLDEAEFCVAEFIGVAKFSEAAEFADPAEFCEAESFGVKSRVAAELGRAESNAELSGAVDFMELGEGVFIAGLCGA